MDGNNHGTEYRNLSVRQGCGVPWQYTGFPGDGPDVPGSSDGFLTKLAFGCAVSLRPLASQSHTRLDNVPGT